MGDNNTYDTTARGWPTLQCTAPPSVRALSEDYSFFERVSALVSGDGGDGGPWPVLMDYVLLGAAVLAAFELLNFLIKWCGRRGWLGSRLIPVRARHLDDLDERDHLFIGLNKAATPPFVYFLVRYLHDEPNVVWELRRASFSTVVVPVPVLFVVFDLFYTALHWFLHIRCVYPWIHQHHHRQLSPSRANVDAVNVHPLEFFLGEYNHLFATYLVCAVADVRIHVLAVLLFTVLGGAAAGINHTRFDSVVRVFGWTLFDSKNHDVHHRVPQSNYGQYTMLWDYLLFRSYRPYGGTTDRRVVTEWQLDPDTGKSLLHGRDGAKAAKRTA